MDTNGEDRGLIEKRGRSDRTRSVTLDSWLSVAVLVGVVATAAHLVIPGRSADASLQPGDPVDIGFEGAGGVERLSNAWPGHCKYVIVADGNCGACRAAAIEWTRDLAEHRVSLPSGEWSVAWLVIGGGSAVRSLFPSSPPFPVFPFADDREAVTKLGLSAVPHFLLISKDGALLRGGGGARLPLADEFGTECDISDPPMSHSKTVG